MPSFRPLQSRRPPRRSSSASWRACTLRWRRCCAQAYLKVAPAVAALGQTGGALVPAVVALVQDAKAAKGTLEFFLIEGVSVFIGPDLLLEIGAHFR